MKIFVIELPEDGSHYTTVINSAFKASFGTECKNNGVWEGILNQLQTQDVIGWVDDQNRFGEPVKRTFILLEK